jgi:hypothetical protein
MGFKLDDYSSDLRFMALRLISCIGPISGKSCGMQTANDRDERGGDSDLMAGSLTDGDFGTIVLPSVKGVPGPSQGLVFTERPIKDRHLQQFFPTKACEKLGSSARRDIVAILVNRQDSHLQTVDETAHTFLHVLVELGSRVFSVSRDLRNC